MNKRSAQGFTLIEMVIAFAILGLTLTVLYGVFENALTRVRHDARLSEATLLAQSLLSRAGSEWPLVDGTQPGKSSEFSYTLTELTQAPPEGEPPYSMPTVQVTATVNWLENQRERNISLSTLKLATRHP